MRALVLGGGGLVAGDLVRVARQLRPIAYSPAALRRLSAERRALESALDAGAPVYGVTTGLGTRVTESVASGEAERLSLQTVRGRANAIGEPLPTEVVRAALAARCASFAHGGSGVSPEVAVVLAELCNRGVHPVVPSIGSVGAADLCQMAFIGLVVVGEGSAEVDGEVLPAAEALRRRGLSPARLGVKDGLVLCASSSISLALAALALEDCRKVLDELEASAACSFEGFRANTDVLDPRVQAARPAPGQAASAAALLEVLAGSTLLRPGSARRLQDPISYRCVPQVHGTLRAALGLLAAAVEAELNGVPDNPLVMAGSVGTGGTASGEIVPAGNFHTASLALGLEAAALALLRVAALSARRMQRLLSPSVSGLPARLVPRRAGEDTATRSGFGPLVKVAHALLAELAHLAAPVPLLAEVDSEAEDDASTAPQAARRLRAMLPLAHRLAAVELLVACQAMELAAPPALGRTPRRLLVELRRNVPSLEEDRPLATDIEEAAATLAGLRRPRNGLA